MTRKERGIDLFAPKLILGVSDEISQVGQIEKIEAVGQLVDGICGLAEQERPPPQRTGHKPLETTTAVV